ncbi:uncharacterized protein LOC131334220 [Rhododendron vialii]|uniref:uncharacterized protein LOC131334220 n=1 Tax=Rhododendron vialii TaxID=182163 RepID=UPI0026601D39|nr:uncharacterized protein LOC131334220 [Rhododendron vialii]
MAANAALEAVRVRVTQLEKLVGDDDSDEGVTLVECLDVVLASVESQKKAHETHVGQTETKFTEMLADLNKLSDVIKERVSNLESELLVVKRAFIGRSDGFETRVKVPELKAFGGARNAKELENFLWDMEQYFSAARVLEADRVTITTMFLMGDAKLWWRTRCEDSGHLKIEQWDTLKKELKDQFLPCNSSWLARESLKQLKHTGSVRDYVKEFSSLMLDIKNMSEEDKVFNFMSGLQN